MALAPMRVAGYLCVCPGWTVRPDCLTFSPRANLSVGRASFTTSSSDGRPHFILRTTFGPPIGLALPCMVWTMVTPPLRAVRMAVSSALTTAPTSASGVMASEPSFVPASAMCVCESMMPGRTKRPAASTTRTPGGAAIVAADLLDDAVDDENVALDDALGHGQDRAVLDQDVAAVGDRDGDERGRREKRENREAGEEGGVSHLDTSAYLNRTPSTKTLETWAFSSKMPPLTRTTLAILPGSSVPSDLSRPR